METNTPVLTDTSQSQQARLAFIEFSLYFLGGVRRADVMKKFNIGPAGATRDFALYRQLAPENINFESKSKSYVLGTDFSPLFHHVPERALTTLSRNFDVGTDSSCEPLLPCEVPPSLSRPSLTIVSTITRAIHRNKAIRLRYCSFSSGFVEREIVPHSLVNSGQRWHTRSFDRRSKEFRDFVLTRMESPVILEDAQVLKHERAEADNQWMRIVELELVPHPHQSRPEITEHDYGMVNGSLHVEVRAALAGYMLRQWQVDCSPNCSLGAEGYQLCLKNPLALYGVNNLLLAPGYPATEPISKNPGDEKKNE